MRVTNEVWFGLGILYMAEERTNEREMGQASDKREFRLSESDLLKQRRERDILSIISIRSANIDNQIFTTIKIAGLEYVRLWENIKSVHVRHDYKRMNGVIETDNYNIIPDIYGVRETRMSVYTLNK